MANKNADLFETLRASGLRKRVARTLADTGGKGEDAVRETITRLRSLADDLETRVTGGSRNKRSAAAQKAARTRRANAAKRSTAAKKGARTRAKASR